MPRGGKQRPRAEKLAALEAHLAQGLSVTAAAAAAGMAASTARNLLWDPDGSKQAARKARAMGTCIACGGPCAPPETERVTLRCRWCVGGAPVLPPPDSRRTVPVRLADIPLDARMYAAAEACQYEHADEVKARIFAAAMFPSPAPHWVTPRAMAQLAALMEEAAA